MKSFSQMVITVNSKFSVLEHVIVYTATIIWPSFTFSNYSFSGLQQYFFKGKKIVIGLLVGDYKVY